MAACLYPFCRIFGEVYWPVANPLLTLGCLLLQTSSTVIHTNNLSLYLGQYQALRNINLSVKKGEILGVLGPNGAGKTSLLNCLGGQIPFSKGEIHLQQRPLSDYSQSELARALALVKQFNDVVFALNVREVVRMGLLPHKSLLSRDTKEDDENIRLALEQVGMQAGCHQVFSSLSGGEQQRTLIARALIQKARVLILDEPTNHLDIRYQHQILSLLKQLSVEFGLTLVMSVHDLNLAAMYCDRLCLLEKGKVAALGTVEDVLDDQLLSRVFEVSCVRRQDPLDGGFRVDIYPQNQTKSTEQDSQS